MGSALHASVFFLSRADLGRRGGRAAGTSGAGSAEARRSWTLLLLLELGLAAPSTLGVAESQRAQRQRLILGTRAQRERVYPFSPRCVGPFAPTTPSLNTAPPPSLHPSPLASALCLAGPTTGAGEGGGVWVGDGGERGLERLRMEMAR